MSRGHEDRKRISRAAAKCAVGIFVCVGCGAPPEGDFHGDEPVGRVRDAVTVAEAVNGGCSTTAVWGLSLQIIEQMNCSIPGGALMEVPDRPNFEKGPATLAFLQPPAVAGLVAALDENPSTTLTSQSMLRTVAQQYLLYRWYQNAACGISLAATPGNSNHESGLAIDVSNHAAWQASLEAHDFSWLGSSDPVHFDFAGPGIVDLSGSDVLAFQELWNANNPGDPITEDGDYGPTTASRLEQSPADGFPTPPSCGAAGTGGAAGAAGAGAGGSSAGTGGSAGAVAGAAGAGATPSVRAEDSSSGCGCRSARDRGGSWSVLFLALLLIARQKRARRKLQCPRAARSLHG